MGSRISWYNKKLSFRGHEIGNNGYYNKSYDSLSYDNAYEDIKKADTLLREITSYDIKLFSAPSGVYNNDVIKAAINLGYPGIVAGSINTMDWRDKLNGLKTGLPEGEEIKIVEKNNNPKLQKEPLRVELDKRNGKPATLITDFKGTDEALKELAKDLKVKCGAGGSSRDGEILIQGDFRHKITEILEMAGFKVKKINFK